MAGTPASRQRLYRELAELLGQEALDELMVVIPPIGWGDIARRQDLTNLGHTLRAELRAEMAELRGDMRTEFAAVRTKMTTALRMHLFAMMVRCSRLRR